MRPTDKPAVRPFVEACKIANLSVERLSNEGHFRSGPLNYWPSTKTLTFGHAAAVGLKVDTQAFIAIADAAARRTITLERYAKALQAAAASVVARLGQRNTVLGIYDLPAPLDRPPPVDVNVED